MPAALTRERPRSNPGWLLDGEGLLTVSCAVAARLLPARVAWNVAGPAELTRQAGEQGFVGGGGEGI
jgi:hypothetical protein